MATNYFKVLLLVMCVCHVAIEVGQIGTVKSWSSAAICIKMIN